MSAQSQNPPSPDRPKVAIHLDHGRGVVVWRTLFAEDRVHESSPYGYDLAEKYFDLHWTADHNENLVVSILRRALTQAVGFDFVHAWRNRKTLCEADVVWTHTEREYLAICLLKKFWYPARNYRVLAQSIWLYDEWNARPLLYRILVRWLQREVFVETVHSSANYGIAISGNHPVFKVPFGADFSLSQESSVPASRPLILAPGNDRHRDWDCLIDAARMMPEGSFHVACDPKRFRKLSKKRRFSLPSNMEVCKAETVAEMARLYAQAACVVVPLRPNTHASGLTVALEAIANGTPAISCAEGGLHIEVPPLEQWQYKTGNANSLCETIKNVIDSRPSVRAEWIQESGRTTSDFVARHILLTRWMLNGEWDPRTIQSQQVNQILDHA